MATRYVILEAERLDEQNGDITVWEEVGSVEAPNSETACRKYAETQDGFEGADFRAIPVRNWTTGLHKMKAETQRRIRPA